MKASETLMYACPHCGQVTDVEPQLVGENVACHSCQKLFQVEATQAHPIRVSAVATDDRRPVINAPADDERDLETMHPAMFRNHPFWYLGMLGVFGAGLFGLVLHLARRADLDANLGTIGNWELLEGPLLLWVSLALIGGGAIYYLIWRIKTWFVTLKVTTERSILQRGLIARRTSEVRHEDVRNLQVSQSLFQRLLGVGAIAISSSGQDDFEIRVRGIPNPQQVVETIRSYQ